MNVLAGTGLQDLYGITSSGLTIPQDEHYTHSAARKMKYREGSLSHGGGGLSLHMPKMWFSLTPVLLGTHISASESGLTDCFKDVSLPAHLLFGISRPLSSNPHAAATCCQSLSSHGVLLKLMLRPHPCSPLNILASISGAKDESMPFHPRSCSAMLLALAVAKGKEAHLPWLRPHVADQFMARPPRLYQV